MSGKRGLFKRLFSPDVEQPSQEQVAAWLAEDGPRQPHADEPAAGSEAGVEVSGAVAGEPEAATQRLDR